MASDATETGFDGVAAFVLGLKVVFWTYALFLFLRVAGPAAEALGFAQQAGSYRSEAGGAVLAVIAIGVAIALFLGLFLATFLFVSVHNTDVVLQSSVGSSLDGASFVTREAVYSRSARVAVEPELFVPPDLAGLVYLLPPAVLVVAGYEVGRRETDPVGAIATVVTGYGIVAVLTIVPVSWLFNEFVADFVVDLASSTYTEATLRVVVPDLVSTHLLVGLGYPLVFGAVGVFLADASS